MNTRRGLSAVLIIAALLALALPVYGAASAQRILRAAAVASLDPIQGMIQHHALEAAQEAWETVVERRVVAEGDLIRTDGLGMAYLTFFEGVEIDILPHSIVKVDHLAVVDQQQGSYEISLNVLVGDTHTRIEQTLDAQSSYEVQTPSAVVAVRGTEFWTHTTWQGDTTVSAVTGVVTVQGRGPNGELLQTVTLQPGQAVTALFSGDLGPVEPITTLPSLPPPAPLAGLTWGNGRCEPDQGEMNSVDCITVQHCGDAICQYDQGEGPIVCPQDCIPQRGQLTASGVPCTVQTDRQGIRVRVGPGSNRGVISFMPINSPVPVIGQAQADDGSGWWQLTIVGVAQAWVAQPEVTASGDCATVGQAAPPPLILPHPTPLPAPSGPSPEQPGPTVPTTIFFTADKTQIKLGECVTLRWDVEGIREVYFQGQGVVGHSASTECPKETTTYALTVILLDGRTDIRYITVTVTGYYRIRG